jgi:fucose 4-O-acetylase-like acetyltransferase
MSASAWLRNWDLPPRRQASQHASRTSRQNDRRSVVVDIAKGIAIILVVYGHCLRGLIDRDLIPRTSWLLSTDYIIYTFHMPLFFMLSGLFFKSSAEKSGSQFWLGRIKTIAYPYFFWSVVQGSVQIALSGSAAVHNNMEDGRLFSILWAPISPFWFLYSLFFCNLLASVLINMRAGALLAGAFVAFVASFFLSLGTIQDIAYGFLYFSLGIFVRERDWLRGMPSSWLAIGLFAGTFLLTAFACYFAGVPERLPFPAALLGIAATVAFCKALLQTTKAAPIGAFFNLVGRCSLSIYVMQILVLGGVRTAILGLFHINDLSVLMPLAITAAVLIPMTIQIVALKLGISNWVGLPTSANTNVCKSKGDRPTEARLTALY